MKPPEASSVEAGSRPTSFAVWLLLGLFLLQGGLSAFRHSITTDEIPHITAGYSYVKTGDFRVNPEHPPLVKLLAGLSLLPLKPVFDTAWQEWSKALIDPQSQFPLSRRFLFDTPENLARHRAMLFLARVPVVLVGLVLCLYAYRLVSLLYGRRAGLLALALACFCPNILAHASLVTTDVPLTAFWLGATYHAVRFLRERRWSQAAACGLMIGLSMAAKFTGVLALAVILAAFLLDLALRIAQRPANPGAPRQEMRALWRVYAGFAALVAGIAACVVLAAYGFSGAAPYLHGFTRVFENHDPRYHVFLLGRYRAGGFPEYYLVALLAKVPLGTLALAGLGALFRKRLGAPLSWPERVLVAAPALVVFTAGSALGKDLGIRYVLPCLPLLWVLAGRSVTLPWASRAPGRWVPVALAVATIVSCLMFSPDFIPYFNELAGGSRGGAAILDDSNIDWGQDWFAVAAYQKKQGIDELRYLSRNMVDPRQVYGIRGRPVSEEEVYMPRTGFYVLGAHVLARDALFHPRRPVRFDWRTQYEPVAVLGRATYVYRFLIAEPGAEAPAGFRGTVLTRDELYSQALARLDGAIQGMPESSGLYLLRARALLAMGRTEQARGDLRRCFARAGKALSRAAAVTVARARPEEVPARRNEIYRTMEEEVMILVQGANLAMSIADADLAVDGLERGLSTLNRFQAGPEAPPPAAGTRALRLALLRGLSFAYGLRFAERASPADLERASETVEEGNRLAIDTGGEGLLDAGRIVESARLWLEQRKAGPATSAALP